jgi:hypothetical protein
MNLPPEAGLPGWSTESPLMKLARPAELEGQRSFRSWHHRLRFWHYAAFGARTSWSIFADSRPVSGRRAVVRRVVWKIIPSPLAPDVKDEISVTDAVLVPEEVDHQIATLLEIPLPLFVKKEHWGLDGETFGLERPHMFHLQWWCEGPEAWRDFASRVASIRTWLENHFEEKKTPNQ